MDDMGDIYDQNMKALEHKMSGLENENQGLAAMLSEKDRGN